MFVTLDADQLDFSAAQFDDRTGVKLRTFPSAGVRSPSNASKLQLSPSIVCTHHESFASVRIVADQAQAAHPVTTHAAWILCAVQLVSGALPPGGSSRGVQREPPFHVNLHSSHHPPAPSSPHRAVVSGLLRPSQSRPPPDPARAPQRPRGHRQPRYPSLRDCSELRRVQILHRYITVQTSFCSSGTQTEVNYHIDRRFLSARLHVDARARIEERSGSVRMIRCGA